MKTARPGAPSERDPWCHTHGLCMQQARHAGMSCPGPKVAALPVLSTDTKENLGRGAEPASRTHPHVRRWHVAQDGPQDVVRHVCPGRAGPASCAGHAGSTRRACMHVRAPPAGPHCWRCPCRHLAGPPAARVAAAVRRCLPLSAPPRMNSGFNPSPPLRTHCAASAPSWPEGSDDVLRRPLGESRGDTGCEPVSQAANKSRAAAREKLDAAPKEDVLSTRVQACVRTEGALQVRLLRVHCTGAGCKGSHSCVISRVDPRGGLGRMEGG